MSSPTGAVRGQLWPTRAQMEQYLANWERHVEDQRAEIETIKAASARSEKVLSDHVSSLRLELAATERPLLEKISGLEAQLTELVADNKTVRNELDAAVTLLATALEVTGTRHSLLALINEAVLLIDEAKKQVRESL